MGLALVGAALSIIGSMGVSSSHGAVASAAVRMGYGLTGLSIVLFIVAGFLAVG